MKQIKIDIYEQSSLSVNSSASIMKSPAAMKSVIICSLNKSPTAFKNWSVLKGGDVYGILRNIINMLEVINSKVSKIPNSSFKVTLYSPLSLS